jgi:N-methylhydantoinase A
MIVTHGHRDVLLWREGPIKNPFNYQIDYPEPYIPRHLTLPVRERINSEGNVDVPLNEEDVINAINEFK